MTIFEKAKTIKTDDQLEKFCFKLFSMGKDWLDVETLMSGAGKQEFVDSGQIYYLYEDWQYDS